MTAAPPRSSSAQYTIQHHKRGADRRAPQSLRDVHPLGKAPVITDGARTVAESGAIVGACRGAAA